VTSPYLPVLGRGLGSDDCNILMVMLYDIQFKGKKGWLRFGLGKLLNNAPFLPLPSKVDGGYVFTLSVFVCL